MPATVVLAVVVAQETDESDSLAQYSSVERAKDQHGQPSPATVGTRCAVFKRVFARVLGVQSVRVHEPEKVYEPVNEQSAVTVPV